MQRPLKELAAEGGSDALVIGRGASLPALDRTRRWRFEPRVAEGDRVGPGVVLGSVRETEAMEHRLLVPPGVEGLVHVTELSWTKRIAKPSDVLKQGEEVEAIVLGINREEQKISLGIRQLEANPWDAAPEKYPSGTKVKGKIRNLTSRGLDEGVSTRLVVHAGRLIAGGIAPRSATAAAFERALADDPDLQASIREVVADFF